ncbi:MAG TPA: formate dehydrogenase subunit alpha [Thermoflexales bacterium]|nr:formate dehydrogenase subunit alpha [Thermoflexales bacterium]HQX09347.1 formate dehydrogenase subunit alpha [Thermoflexales bacterium]HQY23276.1 formate dehydrogenase subunit alpha [Thermoflexales bacterium]HQZ52267.1 formate dehydrogenase subunit alpha [Thermoflexales bacterium]
MVTPDRITTTTCPFCGVGCKLQLHIKDDAIYQVTSPSDAVVNHGNLCVKGRFGTDFIHHRKRVTTPLIRRQPQTPGGRTQAFDRAAWREATWDEALELVTDRLTGIYAKHGPDGLAAFSCAKATNEDNYLLQKLFRALFRTNNIDHCTRLCHAGSVVALMDALGSAAMSNTAAEVALSDVFIVTGSNTAETHPIIALQMKAAVRKRGAKLIVIDPRRIEMVDYAALWLPLRPGTDVPVFSAIAHVIARDGLANNGFIEARTEGYAEFLASLGPFTPEYAESVSGVDRRLIVEAARMYAGAANASIYWALGIPEHTHGTDNAASLIHLALMTGQIGRPGTGLNPLRGQNNVQGASDCGAMPWHYPGYQSVTDEAVAQMFDRAWNVEPGGLNRARGLSTTEIVGAIGATVRGLYVMGENPMMSEPNLNHARHQFEQLEFLVAQDLFMNETAAFADVFLPAASFAEKDGTFTNTDRRVQRVRQAIPLRGNARADWTIVCDLALRIEARLGRPTAGWAYAHPSEVMAEIAQVLPDYAGIRYERLEGEGLQTPVDDTSHPGTPFLFADAFPRGRGLFRPLEYIPAVEPTDETYPLILTTGRVLEHWHGGSITRNSRLDELFPEALMELNPVDAATTGVADGQPVRVSSRRGTITLRAKVTDKTIAGVVFIPFHFVEAAANLLTLDDVDPRAKIPEYKACAVRVEPLQEAARPSKRGRR